LTAGATNQKVAVNVCLCTHKYFYDVATVETVQRRKTIRLGIDTLIANILVANCVTYVPCERSSANVYWCQCILYTIDTRHVYRTVKWYYTVL